jgi:hypothetical protein
MKNYQESIIDILYMPDADISNEHSEVQAVCNAVWTQDVKDAYETFKASQEAALNQE